MLRLGVRSNAQRQRIVALGELLVRHVLPRLGSLHVFRFLDGEIKATLGSDERHNYASIGVEITNKGEQTGTSYRLQNPNLNVRHPPRRVESVGYPKLTARKDV